MLNNIFGIILTIISTIISTLGSFFLKIGSKRFSFNIKDQIKNYSLIGGAILFIIGNVIFVMALKFGELSVFYPISALGYILVSFMSYRFLGEKMNILKWSGVIFIVLGVSLMSFSY